MKASLLITSAALAVAACGSNNQAGPDAASTELNQAVAEDGNLAMTENLAIANAAAAPAMARSGPEYVTLAGGSDLYEIESARLAVKKSKTSAIRDLAQMIIKDHEKSTVDLNTAAQKAEPPIAVAPQMNPEQQANMEMLRGASAAQFDQFYLQQQVDAHQKALAMVKDYTATGDVPSLKEHASAVSGPIQRHLEQAQKLAQPGQQ